MSVWQVQEAKSRFSEVLDRAKTEGPQTITKHGMETAVVMSMEEYRRLAGPTHRKQRDRTRRRHFASPLKSACRAEALQRARSLAPTVPGFTPIRLEPRTILG